MPKPTPKEAHRQAIRQSRCDSRGEHGHILFFEIWRESLCDESKPDQFMGDGWRELSAKTGEAAREEATHVWNKTFWPHEHGSEHFYLNPRIICEEA